jgi:hypothetical protein
LPLATKERTLVAVTDEPRTIDRWPVPKNHRFECCICRDQNAFQADDYLVVMLSAPNAGNSVQWLGAHSDCLETAIGGSMVQIP